MSVIHGNDLLNDNWALVEFSRHEMGGGADKDEASRHQQVTDKEYPRDRDDPGIKHKESEAVQPRGPSLFFARYGLAL